MKKLMVSVAAAALAGAVSASITNKWNDASGYGTEKSWNDPANWWEGHGESDPAPASSVPTEKSTYTLLQKDASITLQAGDDLKVGSLYFGATGAGVTSTGKHIDLTIPTGATLSLEGTDVTTWMGTSGTWQDGGVNNKLLLDVNGGTLNFGQKLFAFRPNMSTYMSSGYNRWIVRNGGVVNITNGYVRLYGGSSGDSQGRFGGTNIIDVCAGSKIRLVGDTSINFGIERFYGDSAHSPWGAQSYYSGGWLNVTGGEIDASENTSGYAAIIMGVHQNSNIGAYLNVTDGGLVNLGGKEIEINSNGRNLIRVASGGVITNGIFDLEGGSGATAGREGLIDVDGGQIYLKWFGTYVNQGGDRNGARSTIRIHGGDSQFNIGRWRIFGNYKAQNLPPFFFDFRLKAHTLRNAEFALRPVNVRDKKNGTDAAPDNLYVHGCQRLSPEGGLQLVHEKTFPLHTRPHDGWDSSFCFDGRYGGVIGDEMWSTNVACLGPLPKWKKYAGYEYVWAYQLTLKDEAKLTGGQVLENPVPRAWFALPVFTARMLNTNKYERISLRLDLVPQGDATLESLVADMKAAGQDGAVLDDEVSPYNVRVDLPVEELAVNAANDSIVMDFVKVDTYPQACQAVPFQTNALIRAACCDMKKIERGLKVIIR